MARRRIGQEAFGFVLGERVGTPGSTRWVRRLIGLRLRGFSTGSMRRRRGPGLAAAGAVQGAAVRAVARPVGSRLALAEALDDRASFRRFCGFSSSEAVPERTAFVRFRKAPVERRLDEVLLGAVVGQLEAQGLVVRSGTLIDATVIRQATKTDGEAEWCVYAGPRRTPVKGEALVAADEDGGIVRRVIVSPGSVHDSRRFEPVLPA
jgi:IS5 family transposase